MLELTNPIFNSIRHPERLGEVFQKYDIIPYYGNSEATSHYMLEIISDYAMLSGSNVACRKDILTYAFGSRVSIINMPEPGLALPEAVEAMGYDEQVNYARRMREIGISLPKLITLVHEVYQHITESGNAYINIQVMRLNGQVQVALWVTHYKLAAYLASKGIKEPWIITTEYWDENWWRDHPPKLWKVSELGKPFNWASYENGQRLETIVHIKTKKDASTIYGRSDMLAILNHLATEFSQGDHLAKTSATETVAKILLAMQEADPTKYKITQEDKGQQFTERMNVLRSLTTVQGKYKIAKSIAGINYPHGSQAPTSIKLDVNRDTNWGKFEAELASSHIYQIYGWDKQLTGFTTVKSNIGGNIIIDLFIQRNIGTIEPLQEWASVLIGELFNGVFTEADPSMVGRTIQFPDIIGPLVDRLREDSGANLEEDVPTTAIESAPSE